MEEQIVTQEVQVDKDIVVLDSTKMYTGAEKPKEDAKLVRKAIGLPIKKQLIYYCDKRNPDSMINVKEYQLVEIFDITERWYTLEITLSDETKVRIHSSYFVEMQKPSFIEDMAAEMA